MTTLPAGHAWLRLSKDDREDPLDPTFAQRHGGRWNPPASWPTLYVNENLPTARANLRRLFVDRSVEFDDLRDDAPFVLVAATLPGRQDVADLRSAEALLERGLPATYPLDAGGAEVGSDRTCPVGEEVHAAGLRGIWCISAATPDGSGRELVWFPASSARATALADPFPFADWRDADGIDELLGTRTDPGRRSSSTPT